MEGWIKFYVEGSPAGVIIAQLPHIYLYIEYGPSFVFHGSDSTFMQPQIFFGGGMKASAKERCMGVVAA